MTLAIALLTRDPAEACAASAISAFREFSDEVVMLHDKGGSAWGDESHPRQKLWEMAVGSGHDWIMVLDDDMVPLRDPRPLMMEGVDGIAFRLFDLWRLSPLHYRADSFWRGHSMPRLWAVKNPALRPASSSAGWEWNSRGIHCGHLPTNLGLQRVCQAPRDFSLLHYAYATSGDRKRKHAQYTSQFHQMSEEEIAHAESILDPEPNLQPLPFKPKWNLSRQKF